MTKQGGRTSKSRRKRKIPVIYWVLFVIFAGVAVFSAWKIISQLREDRKGSGVYVEIASEAAAETTVAVVEIPERETEEELVLKQIDFEALRQQNGDIVAWLELPGTIIDYPVVQADDNSYYLRRLIDGTHHRFGTLFVDYRNAADFSDPNTIIYGHHIHAGDMFFVLENYSDQAFYDEHPYAFLYTPDVTYRVDFFAATVSESESPPRLSFESGEDLAAYAAKLKERSSFESRIEVGTADRVLTLYTCDDAFDDARNYVFGKLVPIALPGGA